MASVAAAVTGGATYYQQHPYASFPRRNSFSVSLSRTPKFHICCNPLPSSLSNLRYLGVFTAALSRRARRRGRARARRRGGAVVTYASLFGVGAPEALVIGVVALLVFGPKGLAEVARNLGKTLRAFQPTIRELQEVSREFKSTLEREIGLDEVQSSLQDAYRPSTSVNEKPMSSIDQAENGAQPYKSPYSSEDLLKITKEQLPASASGIQPQEIANSEVVEPTTVELPSFTLEIAPQVTTPAEEPTSASKVEPPTPAEASVEEKQDMAGI